MLDIPYKERPYGKVLSFSDYLNLSLENQQIVIDYITCQSDLIEGIYHDSIYTHTIGEPEPKEILYYRRHFNIWNKLVENYTQKPSQEGLKQLHKDLLSFEIESAGSYRTKPVCVGMNAVIAPSQITNLMNQLII